jgi:hypothetical protein
MGYSPDILAQMQAGAQEAPAQAGAQQMAATRRSLGEAGLGTSPAAAAVTGDVARNVGDQQVAAQRAVSMANAQQAMQNMQFGVGQQTQIGLSNIEMANQMAMQNANRLFSAMQQNSQQQQQANQFNTQNQVQQQQNNAASKTNYATQLGTMWPSEREQYNLANLQNQTTQQMAPFQAATSLQQNALGYMGQQAPAAPTVQ